MSWGHKNEFDKAIANLTVGIRLAPKDAAPLPPRQRICP